MPKGCSGTNRYLVGRRLVGFFLVFFLELATIAGFSARAAAQVEPPDRRYLYIEDKYKKIIEKKKRETIKVRRKAVEGERKKINALPFDIDAKNLHVNGNTISADGGLTIGYQGTLIEAEEGQVNLDTKEAEFSGDVRVGDATGSMTADHANFNLKTKSGDLYDAKLQLTDGDYQISGSKITRLTGDTFELEDPSFTTCECPDNDDVPWQIDGSKARVTRDGYGHVWDATFNVCQVPILYSPYLLFPAKSKRQTGLLIPTGGYSNENGFAYQQPFFWAINSSSDMTISPLIETRTRVGVDTEYRKSFALTNNLEAGWTYLNESARDGDLRGTDIEGLSNPYLGVNRQAGYLDEVWKGTANEQPFQLIVKGAYVSDNLYLRELDNPHIGEYNDRYVTSTAVYRTALSNEYSFGMGAEYNQALIDEQDEVFQRVPEIGVHGYHSYRPFGTNPIGLRLVVQDGADYVNFIRDVGYQGMRGDLGEKVRLPFHYRNYFESELSGDVRLSQYELTRDDNSTTSTPDTTTDPNSTDESDPNDTSTGYSNSATRVVPGVSYRVSSVLEKVTPVSDGDWIKTLGELGPISRSQEMTRIKQTIEPVVKYRWVPEIDQDDVPIFDSDDRLAERNLITTGVVQRLYARYEPRNPYLYGVEEIVPEFRDLSSLRSNSPLDPALDFNSAASTGADYQNMQLGAIKELVTFKVTQSYDINEAQQDQEENRGPYSDTNFDLTLYPNDYVALRGGTNYNFDESNFASYTVGAMLSTKRGDQLRSRLSFVEDSARQLDSSLELRMTDYTKIAYFSRYDDLEGEFIENRFGTRFYSACNCWIFDIMIVEKVNPDETQLMLNATLFGLGEVGNTVYSKAKSN